MNLVNTFDAGGLEFPVLFASLQVSFAFIHDNRLSQ